MTTPSWYIVYERNITESIKDSNFTAIHDLRSNCEDWKDMKTMIVDLNFQSFPFFKITIERNEMKELLATDPSHSYKKNNSHSELNETQNH